ncbi:MAG: hypothetical protein M1825_001395 [Sarcosagium campestre]|nr:MAG: hypothetical protein M1825_001395 [Sarcosagium campestre]
MTSQALKLKELGNKHFNAGDFKAAEGLFTQAILADGFNPVLFTNRAFARVKLQDWDSVISDCVDAIKLMPKNMKAYYYLAQAQIGLKHPSEALSSALTAYEICMQTGNSSGSNISALILQAKKLKWEARESERLRRRNDLLKELEDRLDIARQREIMAIEERFEVGEVGQQQADEEILLVQKMSGNKIDELRSVFALAYPDVMSPREVPDYLIDNISFSIMHDPVLTKNGQSYDRATILQHLRRSETDPLTREPLREQDLRPNLALRQACDEFIEKNGWAVDY